ncbi:MAG: hypothetical protein R6V49_06525 [Bacteroidales bacterium]
MLLPFQRFIFVTSPSVKELHRKFFLLLEQKSDFPVGRKSMKKSQGSSVPLFTGTLEGDKLSIQSHKLNGEEDIVKIAGSLKHEDNRLEVELRLLFTGSWIATFAGTVVIALVAAYLYGFIGEKLYDRVLANPSLPYLILAATAFYFNLKRYSNKAYNMIQQLAYWLELEED